MNPRGMGMYLRAINVRPKKLELTVKQLLDCGVKWAAIGAMWHEKGKVRWINKHENIPIIARALVDKGIMPYCWGYPWHSTIPMFIGQVKAFCTDPIINGFLIDPELGLRKHKVEAKALFDGLRSRVVRFLADYNQEYALGFTSNGEYISLNM
jgi:hypothetical protein